MNHITTRQKLMMFFSQKIKENFRPKNCYVDCHGGQKGKGGVFEAVEMSPPRQASVFAKSFVNFMYEFLSPILLQENKHKLFVGSLPFGTLRDSEYMVR